MDNRKTEIRETGDRGKGLFATSDIKKDETIFDWDGGLIYEAEKATDLPKDIQDHAIKFEDKKWIDTTGVGRLSSHSCEPNSGIRGLLKLISLRDINKGEEILWDYDMTENSDWIMEECKCGSESCRKLIRGYRFLPEELKFKYRGHISDWLKK